VISAAAGRTGAVMPGSGGCFGGGWPNAMLLRVAARLTASAPYRIVRTLMMTGQPCRLFQRGLARLTTRTRPRRRTTTEPGLRARDRIELRTFIAVSTFPAAAGVPSPPGQRRPPVPDSRSEPAASLVSIAAAAGSLSSR
jgi:hypothetical protein